MAQIISVLALCRLLASSEKAGAKFVWIADDRLMLGAAFGAPEFSVDLGTEMLRSEQKILENENVGAPPVARSAAPGGTGGKHGYPPAPTARSAKEPMPAPFALQNFVGRHTGAYQLILEDEIYAARSQKELLLIGLSVIEKARPGTLAKLEQEKSRTKRIVSRRRETLNNDARLVEKFSQSIADGWWVFTNNSFPETEKFLRKAGFLAGLHVGVRKLA